MMIHPIADEILERLWLLDESNRSLHDVSELRLEVEREEMERAAFDLAAAGCILLGPPLSLLLEGRERGRGIVRRHRLAEILFSEVLDADQKDAEASACELEHMLSERVVDRVCTFLGHPPKCTHGKPIPQGSCCKLFTRKVEPLITRLTDLPIGGTATIAFIAAKTTTRLNRLAVFGVVPGTDIRLLQRKPSVVLACGQTSVAIEDDIAKEIWVRSESVTESLAKS